ncbi:hypothetical protein [Bradyrhizobium cosmicum]|uniref:hypothetical protein n=1 Tax=Bradyrhizobium cosmicum TaxID=1404864 RepID=UPI0028E54E71|nr:hypothetical protein [Bradyrhizobium cosmicum]
MPRPDDREPSPRETAPASRDAAAASFFFLHIRKTAGVSLRGLLANRFPADRILFQAHSRVGRQLPDGAHFVTGHVGFDYAGRFRRRPTIFTVLREPLSRCTSAYDFFQSHSESFFRTLAMELSPEEYQARRRFQERAGQLGATRFLAEEETLARYWLANVQTRQLAGAACNHLRDDDPRLLDVARQHLVSIDLAGILERQSDTLQLLGRMTGWGTLGPLPHLNRTPRSGGPEIDPDSLEILRSWNELDLQLYDEACRLFEQKLGAASAGEPVPELAATMPTDGFTPDQPLHGFGWHEREHHEGRWLCWNSAATATLNLRTAMARPSRLQCLLSHVLNEEALRRLDMSLNGQPLVLRRCVVQGGILLESDLRAHVWSADAHRALLTFHCPVMGRPPRIDHAPSDLRQLGFALTRLRLF